MGEGREPLGEQDASAVLRSPLDSEQVADLVRLARQGSSSAFGKLIEAFRAPIVNLAYQIVGSRADAEDVAQETFVKAFRSIADYREESKFFSWLYRIATNAALDLVRRRRVLPTAYRDDIPSWAADTQDAADEERRLMVWVALGRLPPSQRAAVVLRDMHGFSYPEIAAILGISVSTVGARLRAARRHLERVLGSSPGEDSPGPGGTGPDVRSEDRHEMRSG
jgi:RNA polymerase sigma-70 factor (ECF subfamily)